MQIAQLAVEKSQGAVAFAQKTYERLKQLATEEGASAKSVEQAAKRDYVAPDGRIVRISARTIETWYYAHRSGGLSALAPDARSDSGTSRSMSEAARDLVVRAKREKPRRSIRRIIRMLERAKVVVPGELSASSVHRLLMREGISSRPCRCDDEDGEALGTRVERRSYIAEHVGDLWVGDALHVRRPVLLAPGRIGKAYLLSQIDSASRYVPHSYFAANEQDVDQEHGLHQAIRKYGKPRVYYVDRGPAYVAGSLSAICAARCASHRRPSSTPNNTSRLWPSSAKRMASDTISA